MSMVCFGTRKASALVSYPEHLFQEPYNAIPLGLNAVCAKEEVVFPQLTADGIALFQALQKRPQKNQKIKKNRVGILVVGKKKEEKRIGIF